jgi:orotidine 5'-phosphate decarboxylase subfamily 2
LSRTLAPDTCMSIQTAFEKLDAASVALRSHVCVGLDPDPARMAIPGVFEFNKAIVDATRHAACAYKLQLAFYEALGVPGLQAMEKTIRHIRDVAPRTVIIADCKRGDIGTVAAAYAKAMFEVWGFDIATVMPYMGADSIEPWLQYPDRGIYMTCRKYACRAAKSRAAYLNGWLHPQHAGARPEKRVSSRAPRCRTMCGL